MTTRTAAQTTRPMPTRPFAATRPAPGEPAGRLAAVEDISSPFLPLGLLALVIAAPPLSRQHLVSWLWIGGLFLNVVFRMYGAPAGAGTSSPQVLNRRLAFSFLLEGVLWAGLILSFVPLELDRSGLLCAAVAGAVLLSTLAPNARSAPLLLGLGWLAPVAAIALHGTKGLTLAGILALWMVGVIWLGAVRPEPTRRRRGPDTAVPGGGWSKRAVHLAVQSSAVPTFALQDGSIFEINSAAAALLGRRTSECIGRRFAELAEVDPVNAFDLALGLREGTVGASLRLEGEAPEPRRRVRIRAGRFASGERFGVVTVDVPATTIAPPTRGPATGPAQLVPMDLRAAAQEIAPIGVLPPDPAREVDLPLDPVEPEEPAAGPEPAPSPPVPAVPEPLSAGAVYERLPILAWVVDSSDRVIVTQGGERARWGMREEIPGRQVWREAFLYRAQSADRIDQAVAEAREGRPSYDILVERRSATGGVLLLRSHVVPLAGKAAEGIEGAQQPLVLVMDTIASPRELLETERLRRRKDHYKSLVEASPNLVWACDANFRFTFASRRAARELYGYSVEDMIGVSLGVLLNPSEDQAAARRALAGLREGHSLRDFEMAHVARDGRRIVVGVSAAALVGPKGSFSGAVGIIVDLTALKQREVNLAEALRLERTLLDSAGQALAVVRDGLVSRCNDALLQLLRRSGQSLDDLQVADLFVDRSEWASAMTAADRAALADHAVVREIRVCRSADGPPEEQAVWCQLTVRAIGQGEYVIALADIDSIRRREAHALFDARHDELTGLANRRLFAERARAAMATSALRNTGCAIVVIDLDGFKGVNDRHGHQAGDEVLQEMARRLQRVVRPQDTVARHGGDEFALLIPDADSRRDIEAITNRVLDEVARPVKVADAAEERLSASVGIAMAREQGREPSWLLSLADRAMYDAKASGGNRSVFADNVDFEVPSRDPESVQDIPRAA